MDNQKLKTIIEGTNTFIFDFDGTLINNNITHIRASISFFLELENKKLIPKINEKKEIINKFTRLPISEIIKQYSINIENSVEEYFRHYQKYSSNVTVYPFVGELLFYLKQQKKKLIALTGAGRDIAYDNLKKITEAYNFANGKGDIFEDLFYNSIDFPAKPSSEIFKIAKKRNPNLDLNNTIIIGDSRTDLEFAINTNLPIIIIGNKYVGEYEKLINIKSISDLYNAIKKNN